MLLSMHATNPLVESSWNDIESDGMVDKFEFGGSEADVFDNFL